MTRLQISAELTLPLDTVTQSIAILAKRRMGKSFTARRIVEQLAFARQQVAIVDPKGDWWGIRSSADGKTGGIPITILGGEHGDVPLEVGAGELVAKLVVEDRVSVLLDLSQFRKREVAIFMTAFLETLYRLKAQERYRTPLMLAIDEADAIAPQKPQPEEARMLGAAEDIVRRGGQRGIGCMLITQRSAVLNKNVLTQAEVLIALRTIAPQDRAALDAWFDVHGTVEERAMLVQSLPSLPVGDAWVWSPGWPTADGIFQRIHVLPIATFDSGATPKPGEKRTEPKQIADVDLEKLRGQMAATLERAKAEDPKELRKRVAELERQLAAKPGKPAPAAKRVEIPIVPAKDLLRLEVLVEKSSAAAAILEGCVRGLYNRAQEIAASSRFVQFGTESTFGTPASLPRLTRAVTDHLDELVTRGGNGAAKPRPNGASKLLPGGESVPPAQQRILDALAWLETVGLVDAEKPQLAFLADQSPTSSSYQNHLGRLRTLGLIDYQGGRVILMPGGRAIANPTASPSTSHELQEMVCAKLPPAQVRILRALLHHPSAELAREELAELSGQSPTSSSYQNHLGRMRSLGLIDYSRDKKVFAQPVLFLEGR